MKKTITLIAAVLALCCMAQAQVSFLQGNDMGNNGGTTNSLTYSWTAPTGTTSMAVCLAGDTVAGGHDDITGITYNSTSLTQVGKWTGPDGSQHTNRMMYLYKLNSPTTGSAQNIVVSSTNNHYLLGVVGAYGGSSDIAGTVYTYGPQTSGSYTTSAYTSQGGSYEMICDGSVSPVAGTNDVLEIKGAQYNQPAILDTGAGINPPNSLSMTYTFGTYTSDVRIMAEVLPATTQFGVLQSAGYTSTNSWVFNASDSGMNSCDYEGQAWDTTTSPYTDITSSATFSCDGSYNVTAAFSGNKTGVMLIVPNPIKCSTNTAPCTGTPPTTTHGLIGPPKNPVRADNNSAASSGAFSSSATWTHTISSTCSNPYLIVAGTGALAPSTQTITTATYNNVSMTALTTVNSRGSAINGDPILWVYGIAPASTGSHSITMTASAGTHVFWAATDYCNVGNVVYGQTTPHNEMFGPFTSSPQDETVYPLEAGSMSLLITQTTGTSADTATITTARNANNPPDIYDTKTFVNPGWQFPMGLDFNPSFMTLYYQIIHLRPSPPLYWDRLQSSAFASGTTWTYNATDSGLGNCDYHASAWDTTTSPYTDLTSLATFSCDGSNNVTATFSANQTGKMILVPNWSDIP